VKAEVVVQSTNLKCLTSWEITEYCKASKSSRNVKDLPTLFGNAYDYMEHYLKVFHAYLVQ